MKNASRKAIKLFSQVKNIPRYFMDTLYEGLDIDLAEDVLF